MYYYSYDGESGEYLGKHHAQRDPLETASRGTDVWLLPANATFTAPPVHESGNVAVWNGTAWEMQTDNRGKKYWLPGDNWQTEPRVMDALGPLPEGVLLAAPHPTEDELTTQAVAEARAQSSVILMARMQADMVQTGTFAAAEFATFVKAGLFTDWAAGQTYAKGYRLTHEGIVYEVMQDVTAMENQPPDAAGMTAVYRPLSVDPESGDEPDGSQEHPFAFLYGMDVTKDSYYSYDGKLWLARADMPACVWVPGTAGLWQWEEAGAA